jgi:hypothetical protein
MVINLHHKTPHEWLMRPQWATTVGDVCTYFKLQIDRQIHIFAQEATNKMARTKATARKSTGGGHLTIEQRERMAKKAERIAVDWGGLNPAWEGFRFKFTKNVLDRWKRLERDTSKEELIRFLERTSTSFLAEYSLHDLIEMKKLRNQEWKTFKMWMIKWLACEEILDDLELAEEMERLEIEKMEHSEIAL